MGKAVIINIVLIAIVLIIYVVFFRRKFASMDNTNGYFISTQGETDNRVKALRMDKPSEDASENLNVDLLQIPQIDDVTRVEFKPEPSKDWIIDIVLPNGAVIKKTDIYELFDYEWRKKYRSANIYGYTISNKEWTYAMAGDAPDTFEKLQVGVSLLGVYNDEKPHYDPGKLNSYLDGIISKLKMRYPTIIIEPKEPVENAVAKGKQLVALNHEFSKDAIIVLQSETSFNGMLVWDVLQSAGLKWGDGDLFHWTNSNRNYGDDQLFSVWTTTDPGYFLPEEIKAGWMEPKNLVFGFSIPRNADPLNVFNAMIKTVGYCQKRLGGKILNQDMHGFIENRETEKLRVMINNMKVKGIVPGSNKALTLF